MFINCSRVRCLRQPTYGRVGGGVRLGASPAGSRDRDAAVCPRRIVAARGVAHRRAAAGPLRRRRVVPLGIGRGGVLRIGRGDGRGTPAGPALLPPAPFGPRLPPRRGVTAVTCLSPPWSAGRS